MNRDEAKQFLPIIQAYAEGKRLEYFSPTFGGWIDCAEPYFSRNDRYRIKPEPVECWVVVSEDGAVIQSFRHRHHAAEYTQFNNDLRVIRMREVL